VGVPWLGLRTAVRDTLRAASHEFPETHSRYGLRLLSCCGAAVGVGPAFGGSSSVRIAPAIGGLLRRYPCPVWVYCHLCLTSAARETSVKPGPRPVRQQFDEVCTQFCIRMLQRPASFAWHGPGRSDSQAQITPPEVQGTFVSRPGYVILS